MGLNLRSWLYNNAAKILIVVVWLLTNTGLFIWAFEKYRTNPEFHYTFGILGISLSVSRGAAQVIYFNTAVILLPMCRAITSKLRTMTGRHLKSTTRRLLDSGVSLHILCGYAIFIATLAHVTGHVFNCFHYYVYYNKDIPEANIAPNQDMITVWYYLKALPVWTGILMFLILVVMVLLSLTPIRRKKYEIFWYTHHLSLLFFIFLIVHGFGGIIKRQTNLEEHPPGCEYKQNATICSKEIIFKAISPQAWIWIAVPLFAYMVDRLIRFCRGTNEVEMKKVAFHYGNVMELVMEKKGFKAKPGQYVLLQCPSVAEFEWHPFTLTKCPTAKEGCDGELTVHIKLVGGWTRTLSKRLGLIDDDRVVCNNNTAEDENEVVININNEMKRQNKNKDENFNTITRIKVDGPYGAPSQDVTRFPVGVCIGAGIGVTPFAAVLNYINSNQYRSEKHKLKKLYFIWVCRNFEDLTWFLRLLHSTYKQMFDAGLKDFLVVYLYVTRGKTLPKSSVMGDERSKWMHRRLRYGRPDWTHDFTHIAMQHEKERIGVFFCGPKPLSQILKKTSESTKVNNNLFVYHAESFE